MMHQKQRKQLYLWTIESKIPPSQGGSMSKIYQASFLVVLSALICFSAPVFGQTLGDQVEKTVNDEAKSTAKKKVRDWLRDLTGYDAPVSADEVLPFAMTGQTSSNVYLDNAMMFWIDDYKSMVTGTRWMVPVLQNYNDHNRVYSLSREGATHIRYGLGAFSERGFFSDQGQPTCDFTYIFYAQLNKQNGVKNATLPEDVLYNCAAAERNVYGSLVLNLKHAEIDSDIGAFVQAGNTYVFEEYPNIKEFEPMALKRFQSIASNNSYFMALRPNGLRQYYDATTQRLTLQIRLLSPVLGSEIKAINSSIVKIFGPQFVKKPSTYDNRFHSQERLVTDSYVVTLDGITQEMFDRMMLEEFKYQLLVYFSPTQAIQTPYVLGGPGQFSNELNIHISQIDVMYYTGPLSQTSRTGQRMVLRKGHDFPYSFRSFRVQ